MRAHRVRAAARRLPNDGCPFLVLEIKSKFFRPGERSLRRQYKDWDLRQPWPGQMGKRPVLLRRILVAVVDVDQMCGLVEEIARNQGDHRGLSAAILPDVEDERVGVRHESHGCI